MQGKQECFPLLKILEQVGCKGGKWKKEYLRILLADEEKEIKWLYQEQKQSTSGTLLKKASIGTYLKYIENLSAYEQKIKRWTEVCKPISKCKICTKKWQVSIVYFTYCKL